LVPKSFESSMATTPLIPLLDLESARLPPGPRVLSQAQARDIHRQRLIAGFARAAGEKGYAATTIGDVVAGANVSKRTFYEHFADLHDCFLTAYEAFAEQVMAVVAQAVADSAGTWRERIAAGLDAYLNALAQEPRITRVFLVDILGAGGVALARRRAVHQRFAELIQDLVRRHADQLPAGYELDGVMAHALVGAIHELVLIAIEQDRGTQLPELHAATARLVGAVLATGEERN
jgi:AcrR family transcriptional regulator